METVRFHTKKMAEQYQDNQLQFLISDLGTRVRDLEERSSTLREKLFLIGQNLLDTKEESQEKILEIEKQNSQITNDLKKIRKDIENIAVETRNFVRKDEIILVERMLKDFQPLEFITRKNFEETIKELKKEIKGVSIKT